MDDELDFIETDIDDDIDLYLLHAFDPEIQAEMDEAILWDI